MKRFPILLVLLALCSLSLPAKEESITVKRTVLQAAEQFDNIVINGDITVECRFNPQYEGFIVYHNSVENHLLSCRNEGSTLVIDGDKMYNKLMSRVVVFCGDSLNAVTVNDNGKLLIRRTPKLGKLRIDLNGAGVLKARTLEAGGIEIVNNGEGEAIIAEANATDLSVSNGGSGGIVVKKGKADNAELSATSSGSVDAAGVQSRKVDAKISGDGGIECRAKEELAADLQGGGLLRYNAGKKVKKSISGNADNALGK